ncbi:MAG: caspase family protein [Bacteroidales bacterium]|nr:caspase family protein [Bacteroidales bacterium]
MNRYLFFKILIVFTLLSFSTQIVKSQNWFLVCSKNTGESNSFYTSQYYFEDMKTDIREYWDKGYYVSNIEYNGYYWITTFSSNSKITDQTWIKHNIFPKETIQEKWDKGFYITDIAFGEGEWLIIMSKGLGYEDDIWRTKSNYEDMKTEIQKYWDLNYRITNIEYGDGMWAFSMAKGTGIIGQTFNPNVDIPADWIKEKWEEDFDVTDVAYGEGKWLVVMSGGLNLNQTYYKDDVFPVDWVKEKVTDGYVISSFCSSTNNTTTTNIATVSDVFNINTNDNFIVNRNYTSGTKQTFNFKLDDYYDINKCKLFIIGKDYNYDSDADYTDFKILVNEKEVFVGQLNSKSSFYSENLDSYGFDIENYIQYGPNTVSIQNTEDEGQGDYALIYSIAVNYDKNYNQSHGKLTEAEYLHVAKNPDNLKINFLGNDDNYTVVNIDQTGNNTSCIQNNTYIIDKKTNKKYFLQKAENILICKDKTYKYTSNFTLYFDKIPETTTNIDLIEPAEGNSYSFYDISFEFPKNVTEVVMPPILKIGDISFSENVLDAGETAKLSITIENVGPGDANDVYVNLSTTTSGITLPAVVNFPIIPANNGKKTVTIDVTGQMSLKNTEATIKIDVVEPHFMVNIQGKQLKFTTKSFNKPDLILAQYAIIENQSANPNNQIDINEILELKLIVQNIGQGNAEKINIDVINNQSGVMFLGVMENGQLIRQNPIFSEINAGKYVTIIYRYFVNSEFTDSELKFTIKAKDNSGLYGFTEIKSFAINKELEESGFIHKVDNTNENENEHVIIENIPNEIVDVDQNIPKSSKIYANRYALIIGNANYQKNGSDVVDISYSLNDARIFKKYAVNTLGIPDDERHIYYLEDAKALELKEYLENFSELIKLKPAGSEFFVYYSGHGTLDSSKNSYILPVDVKSRYVEDYALSLDDFYAQLNSGSDKKTYIFIDACFSGGGKTGVLVPYSKVGLRQSKNNAVPTNILVFAASTGTEISQEYPEKQHGLFTYFLLKELQNMNSDKTFNEIGEDVINNVKSETLVPSKNLRTQTPTIKINPSIQNEWKNWKINP